MNLVTMSYFLKLTRHAICYNVLLSYKGMNFVKVSHKDMKLRISYKYTVPLSYQDENASSSSL